MRLLLSDAPWTPPQLCFKIPSQSKPSGQGKIWEYYHFLVDFAAPLVALLQNEYRGQQKVVVLPNWYPDYKFSLQNKADPKRNMETSADFLFRPLKVSFINWGNQDQYNALPCRTLNFHSGAWSSESAATYDRFRSYAHRLIGYERTSPPLKYDIVLLRRASVSGETCTGSCRRHLHGSFFADFTKFMESERPDAVYRIVETDEMGMAEQIEVFSSARMIIGMHGAGLSNWVFAQRAATVVELGNVNFPCFKPIASKLLLQYHHCQETTFTSCLQEILKKYLTSSLTISANICFTAKNETSAQVNSSLVNATERTLPPWELSSEFCGRGGLGTFSCLTSLSYNSTLVFTPRKIEDGNSTIGFTVLLSTFGRIEPTRMAFTRYAACSVVDQVNILWLVDSPVPTDILDVVNATPKGRLIQEAGNRVSSRFTAYGGDETAVVFTVGDNENYDCDDLESGFQAWQAAGSASMVGFVPRWFDMMPTVGDGRVLKSSTSMLNSKEISAANTGTSEDCTSARAIFIIMCITFYACLTFKTFKIARVF